MLELRNRNVLLVTCTPRTTTFCIFPDFMQVAIKNAEQRNLPCRFHNHFSLLTILKYCLSTFLSHLILIVLTGFKGNALSSILIE